MKPHGSQSGAAIHISWFRFSWFSRLFLYPCISRAGILLGHKCRDTSVRTLMLKKVKNSRELERITGVRNQGVFSFQGHWCTSRRTNTTEKNERLSDSLLNNVWWQATESFHGQTFLWIQIRLLIEYQQDTNDIIFFPRCAQKRVEPTVHRSSRVW